MRALKIFLPLTAVCALLIVGAPESAVSTSASTVVPGNDVPAAARQELAIARNATAKYHDIEQALADGFVQVSACIPGEGIHFRREFPLDCEFDPAIPEALHYVPKPNGELQLIGIEYFVPRNAACGTLLNAPEGFSGDADEWETEMGGTAWALNAWVWEGVPDGVFAFRSDKITCE